MADPLQMPSDQPKAIAATLFLERPADIDHRLLVERIGKALDIDPKQALLQKSAGAFIFSAGGEPITGMRIDAPYPIPMEGPARFAYYWPEALKDLARHKAHLMVFGKWSRFSRLDAHMRHLIVVRELIEQLPVIGVLWGAAALVQTSLFKGEFHNAQKGAIPFSLWVIIQYSGQPNGNILISTIGMRNFGLMEIETESVLPIDQDVRSRKKFRLLHPRQWAGRARRRHIRLY